LQIFDNINRFITGPGGELAIKRTQEIPEWFLDDLRASKLDSTTAPAGDFHRVCAVPAGLAEQWLAEGYDVYKQPAAETIKRLRAAQLDAFITTNKRI
jgi:hypothetical protein